MDDEVVDDENQPQQNPDRAIQLVLQPDGVAAPAQHAATVCREIIDFYFDALAKADLRNAPPPTDTFFRFKTTGLILSETERRTLHESWNLAKAFQDLMRGVRGTLEEASLFIELLSIGNIRVKSDSTLDDVLAPFRKRAANKKFPALLEHVNSKLETPLEFLDAYQSMQDARNCLEHRGGGVSKSDAGEDGMMELRFPRVKMFLVEESEEIELQRETVVEADTTIFMRLDVRIRRFKVGERLTIAAGDFDEIAFACSYFGSQLSQRLPKVAPKIGGNREV
jgi:hypothetical protein